MRNFSKTLTLMGLLAPVGASALGVGEIKLHSALNQVLEAEIPLIAAESDSASDIRVNLASPSAFAKAGLERPYYLSRLRFKPVIKNGKMVIMVVSKDVIREPFLNFLVEVNWPQGRMLREFTVLLDPPSTFNESTITATQAPTVKSKTVTKPSYPIDQPSNYGFRSAPRIQKNSKPSNRSAPPAKKYKPGEYVSTRRNDSLWALAKRVNSGSSVSHEQMMVALYESNPHAFYKKNMNALKAGQRLKVPSQEAVKQLSRKQALAELARQNDQWSGKVSASTEKNPSPSSQKTEEAQKSTDSKLKLVSPAVGETIEKSTTDLAASSSNGKAELAMEIAETVSQENDELRTRLKQVEDQLNRMQQMLTLKDKQLSALQSQQGTETAKSEDKVLDIAADKADIKTQDSTNQPAELSESSPASISAESEKNASVTALGEVAAIDKENNRQTGGAEPTRSELPGQELSSETTAAEDTMEKPQPSVADAKPTQSNTSVSAGAEKERVTPPVEEDLLTELLSEPAYLAAGAGGIVLLAILGWALVRRRNRMMMVETESILSSPDTVREPVAEEKPLNEDESNQVQEIGMVAESSFLSEFTPSDFDALESDHEDVDPISEADVYLAYGRYQQAEDLIRSAIENYPERDECKLKLLEIHYATEDRDAYESYAKELEAFKNDKPEFWVKVAEMGREICPHSILFSNTESDSTTDFSEETQFPFDTSDDSSTDLDIGREEIRGLDEADNQDQEDDFDGSIDIDFDGEDNLEETVEFKADSDLSFEESALPDTTELPEASEEETTADDNGIEFDTFSNDNNDNSLDFTNDKNIGESSEDGSQFNLESNTESDIGVFEDHNTEDLEHSIETLELEMDVSDTDAAEEEAVSDEFTDLTDMDEIETKLDLAKAYVDMDDEDSARGILTEILEEGNDDQKNEAQALVNVLEHKA